MAGIKDLDILLSCMEPVLDEQDFVFCTFPNLSWDNIRQFNPIGVFSEKEGMTLILSKKEADNQEVPYESVYKLISLNIHSSLDAVGLTAAFSAKLAENNISANVVAAYYHDHIFVPAQKAELAMAVLNEFKVV
ncbi:ACT domain-containing protein [Dysgonomonas sp. 216]|uniref:ACT domain-containing protein n=1 Tax=Dysgonomonas sp. 216 TaxID=2302934 RepID=UPI0013D22864|nr:ACT domain-containing protein [Dysgonomonas sp. 216]NDW19394.1 ACT domain-containing protein [Dysgonomonas sp. 216]